MNGDVKQFRVISGVFLITLVIINKSLVKADVNFKSRPTTVKTFENDSVLLPCYSAGKKIVKKMK